MEMTGRRTTMWVGLWIGAFWLAFSPLSSRAEETTAAPAATVGAPAADREGGPPPAKRPKEARGPKKAPRNERVNPPGFPDETYLTSLVLSLPPRTRLTVTLPDTDGEAILEFNPPSDNLESEIARQFNSVLTGFRRLESPRGRLRLRLFLSVPLFRYEMETMAEGNGQILTLKFYAPPAHSPEEAPAEEPKPIPLTPARLPFFWLLFDTTAVLPPPDYRSLAGVSPAMSEFRTGLELFETGALKLAEAKIKALTQTAEPDVRGYALLLLSEIFFREYENRTMDRKTVADTAMEADLNAPNPVVRARARLLLGHVLLRNGRFSDAEAVFTQGGREYPPMNVYFALGLLETAVQTNDRQKAQSLLAALGDKLLDLGAEAQRKACFSEALLSVRFGATETGAEQVRACLALGADTTPPSAPQLLAAAETFYLNGDPKSALFLLDQVIDTQPGHERTPLASIRKGEILVALGMPDEAREALRPVARLSSSESPYAPLAAAELNWLENEKEGKPGVVRPFLRHDLLSQPEPMPREAKLRLLAQHAEQARFVEAYAYLIELFRRYEGPMYWTFAPDYFTRIVRGAFEELTRRKDHSGLILAYQARDPLPLLPGDRAALAMQVAKAYQAMGYWEESVQTYQEALERGGYSEVDEKDLIKSLIHTYLEMKDHDRARKALIYYFFRFPGDAERREYYLLRGKVEEEEEAYEEAVANLEQAAALARTAEERERLILMVARARYFQRRYPVAADLYEKVLGPLVEGEEQMIPARLSPEKRVALFLYADSLYKTGRYQSTLKTYETARRLLPDHPLLPFAHYYGARARMKTYDRPGAIEGFKALAKLEDPFWRDLGESEAQIVGWYQKHEIEMKP